MIVLKHCWDSYDGRYSTQIIPRNLLHTKSQESPCSDASERARKCKRAIQFDSYTFQLEVIHDKIPNGSMTSHDFYDLFCSFGYLRIKQSGYNQRKRKRKYAKDIIRNSVY